MATSIGGRSTKSKTRESNARAVIVGAAGVSGSAAAQALADRGFDLVLVDNDPVGLGVLADRFGAAARFCDVASETSILILASEIDRIGPFDLLINAAGPSYVRMLGMLRISHALAGRMRTGSSKRFIMNIAARHAPDELFSYASSDVAFRRMSTALASSLAGSGTEVIACEPENSARMACQLADRIAASDMSDVSPERASSPGVAMDGKAA